MLECLIVISILSSGFTGFAEITETDAYGCVTTKMMTVVNGEILENTGQVSQGTIDTGGTDLPAGVLWVDSIHNLAVANKTVICSDGEGILVSWFLNDSRISRYDTFGSGTPLWNHPMPGNNWQFMDVDAGQDNLIFSACSPISGTFAWLSDSPDPTLSLDPGQRQGISSDGLYLVHMNSSGDSLVCVDTSTGFEIWKTELFNTKGTFCGVEICGNGTRVLASAYDVTDGCQVFDMADGSQIGASMPNGNQDPPRISDDGTRLINASYDGCIKFYEFDGTSWILVLDFDTGHPWATAVGISSDGQTAAGGTEDYNADAGKVIAFDWPAGGSPTQLWQYNDYGGYVSSIDISEDGSVIVAGCWGMYQATFGDVFTAFDRNGNVIFKLLDDIHEPGSILSVSVSSDGSYATASGKAVHALEMGNGGQVYCIDLTNTGMEGTPADPLLYSIGEPYPNPTVSLMSLELHVPPMGRIDDLAVYSLDGRRVATLNCATTQGDHISHWDITGDSGESLSAGLYLIRLSAHRVVLTRKVMILN